MASAWEHERDFHHCMDKLDAIKQVIKDIADGEISPYDGIPMDKIKEILQSSTPKVIK